MVGIAGSRQPLAYHRTPCSWPSHTSTLPSCFWRQRGWQEDMKTWGRPCDQCQAGSVASRTHSLLSSEQEVESWCTRRYRCHSEIISLHLLHFLKASLFTMCDSPGSCLNFLGQRKSSLGPKSGFQSASPCTSGHPQWARPRTSAASQPRLLQGKNKGGGFTAPLALPSAQPHIQLFISPFFPFFFLQKHLAQELAVKVCLF